MMPLLLLMEIRDGIALSELNAGLDRQQQMLFCRPNLSKVTMSCRNNVVG